MCSFKPASRDDKSFSRLKSNLIPKYHPAFHFMFFFFWWGLQLSSNNHLEIQKKVKYFSPRITRTFSIDTAVIKHVKHSDAIYIYERCVIQIYEYFTILAVATTPKHQQLNPSYHKNQKNIEFPYQLISNWACKINRRCHRVILYLKLRQQAERDFQLCFFRCFSQPRNDRFLTLGQLMVEML